VLGSLALLLLYEAKSLLIGEAADPEVVEAIRAAALKHDGVDRVGEVLTVHTSPEMVTCIISADFDDALSARDVERIVFSIEKNVSAEFPMIARIYVRPSDSNDIS